MTDARPISREDFFALYWDHAREIPRYSLCLVAHFPKPYAVGLSAASWSDIQEPDRAKLRVAVLDLLEVHAHNREVERKQREALKPAPRLENGDAPGPAEKIAALHQ